MGITGFEAWPGMKHSPLHGSYVTEDFLQHKRYQAPSNGTIYVYDFPASHRKQALHRLWKDHINVRPEIEVPNTLIEEEELVLDGDEELVAVKRPPGENSVGMVVWKIAFHSGMP